MDRKDGMAVRALMRLRCGNMEEENKYWLSEEVWICVFCGEGWDNMEHYIGECEVTKDWFKDLGNNKKEREKRIWEEDLNDVKAEILKKLWKEKERKKKERREDNRKCDTETSQ